MASTETMRCLGCGYNLRGLPERRCPECGREYDPDKPQTFDPDIHDGRRYLWRAIAAAVCVSQWIVISSLFDREMAMPGSYITFVDLGFFAGLILAFHTWAQTRKLRYRAIAHPRRFHAAMIIVGVIRNGLLVLMVIGIILGTVLLARWLLSQAPSARPA